MKKSTVLSLLFFLIFLVGILGIGSSVNQTLNKKAAIDHNISSHLLENKAYFIDYSTTGN